MEQAEHVNNKNEKLKGTVWKQIFKEFAAFKFLCISGLFFSGLIGVCELVQPKLTNYVIDVFVKGQDLRNFIPAVIFTVAYVLIAASITFVFIMTVGTLEVRMCHRLRTRCFNQLQSLSLSFYDTNSVGSLMSRMTSDINKLSDIVAWGGADLLWGSCMIIALILIMFKDNSKLAAIALITFPLILIVSGYLRSKILKAQRKVRAANAQLTAAYNEDIQGAKTTKTLVREALNAQEFFAKTEDMKVASVRGILLSSILMPAVQVIGALGTGLVVVYGGNAVMSQVVSLGLLVAFFSYIAQFNYPLMEAATLFAELISAQAAAERIFALLDEKSDVQDSPAVIQKYGTALHPTNIPRPSIKGDVRFEQVSFWYKENEPVLTNFSLSVAAGQTVALVGSTGAGKSTIVNLFCRFYEPKEGQILIDGIDYTQMPETWIHENLGYVLQSPHLFSGTIEENIRYGKLDATMEEIIAAAKLVDAHEFISAMPEGYQSQVGEGGALLSTGQKQLISFARTLVRNPRLFVLDEATSSIDTETEQKIQKAIAAVLKGRTSFVVAHRLSTIRNADMILVIEKGKMIECGTHEELLQKKGHYCQLYSMQSLQNQNIPM
jgi:lipid A export ATP-binding/permease protein msbA